MTDHDPGPYTAQPRATDSAQLRDRFCLIVIFDCDGVLIDSEIIFGRVLGQCLIAADFPITMDEAMVLGFGKNRITLTAEIETRFGLFQVSGPMSMSRSQAKPLNTGHRKSCSPHCRRRVASLRHIDRLRHALTVTRLLPLFEPHVFSASQVERGKPAPDLVLFAARQFDAPREQCIVVEDSTVAAGISWDFAAALIAPPTMPSDRCGCSRALFVEC